MAFRLHKEGKTIILITLISLIALNTITISLLTGWGAAAWVIMNLSLIPLGLVLQFFRNPVRTIPRFDDNIIYAPADGKIVVIEETQEDEFFKDKRIQISIFMSPFNVHVNRNPISGTVEYFKYHKGLYLVAWHPKASTDNERTTVVYTSGNNQILMRQIAGFVARRIVAYIKTGNTVKQGDDMGFIKFGSRVDLFLPLDAKINVKIGDLTQGNITEIARFK